MSKLASRIKSLEKNEDVQKKVNRMCGAILGSIYAHAKSKQDFNPEKDHIVEQAILLLEECKESKMTDYEGFGANPSFLKGAFIVNDIDPSFKEFLTNGGNPSDYDLTGPDYYITLPFCALFKIPINTALIKVQLSHTSPTALFNTIVIVTLINCLIKTDLYDLDLKTMLARLDETILPAYSKYLIDMLEAKAKSTPNLGDTTKMRLSTKIHRVREEAEKMSQILKANIKKIDSVEATQTTENDVDKLLSFIVYHHRFHEAIDLDELKLEYPSSIVFGSVVGAIIGFTHLPKNWKHSIPSILEHHFEDEIIAVLDA